MALTGFFTVVLGVPIHNPHECHAVYFYTLFGARDDLQHHRSSLRSLVKTGRALERLCIRGPALAFVAKFESTGSRGRTN